MCQPMPISRFRWLEPNEIRRLEKQLKNGKYKQEKGTGYIFEADLEYPAELHWLHSDDPLAPERVCVAREEQSLLQQEMRESFRLPHSGENSSQPCTTSTATLCRIGIYKSN